MDTSSITYNTEGFDADASAIISLRLSKLQTFAHQLLVQQGVDSVGIGDDVLRTTLRTVVDTVQDQRYSVVSVDSPVTEATFLPLAQALGIPEKIRRQQLHQWWKAGLFHTSFGKPTRDKERSAIILNLLDEQVTTILNSSLDETVWYRQFCEKNVCRDDSAAARISQALDNVNLRAASIALDIARAWCTHGNVGLLTNSIYPYTHELLRIEQHRTTIQIKTTHINTFIATLRADVAAVLRMLDDLVEATRMMEKPANQICIADHSVLHQPAYTSVRRKFRERLVPVREYCIAALAQCRARDPTEATILLDTVFANGIAGLIAWRASTLSEGHADTFDWHRIKHIAGPLIDWMPSEVQQVILKRLRVCVDADAAVGTELAFTRLVKDLPSTLYRRRLQRRRFTAQFYITFADSWTFHSVAAVI